MWEIGEDYITETQEHFLIGNIRQQIQTLLESFFIKLKVVRSERQLVPRSQFWTSALLSQLSVVTSWETENFVFHTTTKATFRLWQENQTKRLHSQNGGGEFTAGVNTVQRMWFCMNSITRAILLTKQVRPLEAKDICMSSRSFVYNTTRIPYPDIFL
jgi:hypothetical protein